MHVAGLAGVLAACWSLSAPARAADGPRRPPNIVLILADDLGYGDVGCYGQEVVRTPYIDRLAAEGRRYTQFYAGSTVCAPSRCVLMTGLNTGHCLIRGNAKTNLRPEDVTVAEVLKSAGYAAGLSGKWGLGHEGSSGVPTRQGFDHFFGYLDQHHAHNYYPAFLVRGEERVALENVVPGPGQFGGGVATKQVRYSPDLIVEDALTFIEQNRHRPFFLYLAVTLPHANNEARKKGMEIPDFGDYAERDWPDPQKGHAAMISRLDTDVGRVMELLKRLGIDEQTIVFFSSDNGPHAEGGADPEFFNSNGPLRGIKRDLYEGGIRVPLIVRWPGRVAPGTTSGHVGYFADFLPTAAELTGAEPPDGTDGISFVPDLVGEPERQRRHEFLYWEFYEGRSAQAVRAGDWKGIVRPLGGDTLELYDLGADPAEEHDVAEEQPETVARLKRLIRNSHVPSPLWTVKSTVRK